MSQAAAPDNVSMIGRNLFKQNNISLNRSSII